MILGRGRVVATGTAAELLAQSGAALARGRLRARCSAPAKAWPRDGRRAQRFGARAHRASVARKEIVDIFRDRRTMLVTLVTAIVAGPVLMLLVLNLVARQADKARELKLPVAGTRARAGARRRSSSASR